MRRITKREYLACKQDIKYKNRVVRVKYGYYFVE